MAELQYLDNTANPEPNVTALHAGDYLVSPSGVYNAVLNSDGSFVVSYGNVPNTDPTYWSTKATIPGPYTVQNTPGIADWYINGYTNNGTYTYSDPLVYAFTSQFTPPSFLQLDDAGYLEVYQGNNGVKTNPNENIIGFSTQTPNQVISLKLNTITYDTAHAVYGPVTNDATTVQTDTNNTPTQQLYPCNLSLAYTNTETFTWNMTESLSATLSTSDKIGVPGIGETTNSLSVTGSVSLSEGQSSTETVTQTATSGASISVPADSTYQTIITGETQSATVPYTWSGTASYANGISAAITGTGSVSENSTGVFNVITTCVSTPGGCPPPGSPLPIPEPATFVTVPMAFAAMLALAAARRRRNAGRFPIGGALAI
ncbi:MAG: hypothetical protein JOY52_22710 [Hyphomicrobiales bacterium]|nr:hypothetical protein [Hyphomicrobiales bacterium]